MLENCSESSTQVRSYRLYYLLHNHLLSNSREESCGKVIVLSRQNCTESTPQSTESESVLNDCFVTWPQKRL